MATASGSEAQMVRLGGATRSPVAGVASGKPAGVRRKWSVNRCASIAAAVSGGATSEQLDGLMVPECSHDEQERGEAVSTSTIPRWNRRGLRVRPGLRSPG